MGVDIDVYLTTAKAGNPLYAVVAPDGICVYVPAGSWRLEKRLQKAKVLVLKRYEKRCAALRTM